MRLLRPPVPGAVVIALLLAGCTEASSQQATGPTGTLSSPTTLPYTPTQGTPAFCAEFADASALTNVPTALATLLSKPGDASSQAAIHTAAHKAAAIAEQAKQDGRYARVTTVASDLSIQLDGLVGQSVTADALKTVGNSLSSLGGLVQPICKLPT